MSHICKHAYTSTHTYIHAHVHTHTHIHIHTRPLLLITSFFATQASYFMPTTTPATSLPQQPVAAANPLQQQQMQQVG